MNNLLVKAKNNITTASFAEKQKFYDVAVSRYYYSLFEKIIYISKSRGFYKEPEKGEDSHNITISAFTQNMVNSLEPEELSKCAILNRLKRMRVDADYKDIRIEELNDYSLKFKYYYNQVEEVLDKCI